MRRPPLSFTRGARDPLHPAIDDTQRPWLFLIHPVSIFLTVSLRSGSRYVSVRRYRKDNRKGVGEKAKDNKHAFVE
jgi:hypothetical protein